MAKRRKTRYSWLYNTGTTGPVADVEDDTCGRDFGLIAVPTNGTTALTIIDMLRDLPSDDFVAAGTLPLGVSQNNDYVIKRIVGKFFISVTQQVIPAIAQSAVLVGAGLFVARAEDADIAAGAENLPIGAAVGTGVDDYSPLRVENIRQPWIWRRNWILSNQLTGAAPGSGLQSFPQTTAQYGSIQDGPHVDAKTGRRVKDGERLFAVVAARSYPLNSTADTSNEVRAYFDYRVLGAMRRGHNRSAF